MEWAKLGNCQLLITICQMQCNDLFGHLLVYVSVSQSITNEVCLMDEMMFISSPLSSKSK